ncbi:MAG: hypothetical protein RL653_873 [Pseudomonadota bacterium]
MGQVFPGILVLVVLAPAFGRAEVLEPLYRGRMPDPDHPAAAYCKAHPSLCTCAVEQEEAYEDSRAGRAFVNGCVARLLGAKNTWTACNGQVLSWRPGVRYDVKKRAAEAECLCMAEKQPRKRVCARWAGVNADFGAERPKHPWYTWGILEDGDGEAPGLRWRCRHPGVPNQAPCKGNPVSEYQLKLTGMGHWKRASTPAPGPAPDASRWAADRDNADENEVTYTGRYLRVGEWLLFGTGGKPGWAQGSFSWEEVDGVEVSRRSGTWRYWTRYYSQQICDGTDWWFPDAVGELFPVGPRKRSLPRGKWLIRDEASSTGQENVDLGEEGTSAWVERSFKITRDPSSDTFISTPGPVTRLYRAPGLALGKDGRLDQVSVEGPVLPRTLRTTAGPRPLSQYRTRDSVQLEAGRVQHLLQEAWNSVHGKWTKHGLEVSWRDGKVWEIREWTWDVPLSAHRFGPSSTEERSWSPGSVERTKYGMLTNARSARDVTGEAGAWAVVEPNEAELGARQYFPPIPQSEWFGIASPREEYRLKAPARNTSSVVCESDEDCKRGEQCKANACLSFWEEGWRKDRVPPFLSVGGAGTFFALKQASDESGGPWLVEARVRADADGLVDEASCRFRVGNDGAPWTLVWLRSGGEYEHVGMDTWMAEQAAGTSPARAERRACFNLPLPTELAPGEVNHWLRTRVLGRGLDEYLGPALEASAAPQ